MVGADVEDLVTDRARPRGAAGRSIPAELQKWRAVIRAEYLELPALCLTAAQLQRLLGLDCLACRRLLEMLVSEQFLKRTADARYVRADSCGHAEPATDRKAFG